MSNILAFHQNPIPSENETPIPALGNGSVRLELESSQPTRQIDLFGFISPWLMVIALAGYPLIALVGTAMNIDSRNVSVPFRVAVLGLSVAVILVSPHTSRWLFRNFVFFAFMLMYCARLAWDWIIADAPGIPTADYILLFFGVSCLVPSIAIGTAHIESHSDSSLAWKIAIVGALTCLLSVIMESMGWGVERSLKKLTGRLFFDSVNPITLGHLGVTTLLALLCLNRKLNVVQWVLVPFLGLAAILCIVYSGSRGPIVSLAICTVVFSLVSRRWFWVAVMSVGIVPLLLDEEGVLYKRLAYGLKDQSTQGRFVSQNAALEMFFESPTLGSAFADRDTLSYPHNLFIEVAMSMGGVGLILLAIILWVVYKHSRLLIAKEKFLIPILFIQYFVAIQFSGSIWGSYQLWSLCAVLYNSPILDKRSLSIPQSSQ